MMLTQQSLQQCQQNEEVGRRLRNWDGDTPISINEAEMEMIISTIGPGLSTKTLWPRKHTDYATSKEIWHVSNGSCQFLQMHIGKHPIRKYHNLIFQLVCPRPQELQNCGYSPCIMQTSQPHFSVLRSLGWEVQMVHFIFTINNPAQSASV